MDATEKRKLETELLKMGLAGLKANGDPSPELVQQIAAIVNHWKPCANRHGEWIDRHKFLRDLFAECDEADRSEMYAAITPYLTFQALPLSYYEMMMTERMARLVSKGAARTQGRSPHPVQIGGRKYRRASKAEATHAIATLVCPGCGKQKRFLGDTPVGALIEARKAGWQRMPDKWHCPICVKAMARKARKELVN